MTILVRDKACDFYTLFTAWPRTRLSRQVVTVVSANSPESLTNCIFIPIMESRRESLRWDDVPKRVEDTSSEHVTVYLPGFTYSDLDTAGNTNQENRNILILI